MVEVDATLILWGDRFDPDAVTSVMGFSPTRARKKGDLVSMSGKSSERTRTGMWTLCTSTRVKSGASSDHIRFLLQVAGKKLTALTDAKTVDKARLSVMVSVSEDAPTWEEEIEPDLLRTMGELKVSLAITVLCPLSPDARRSVDSEDTNLD
jgi:hypothetical protein